MIKVLPPKTIKEVVAGEKERKARTTLLMALPEDHSEKFHKMADAKEMWEAIKSRFGGNDESKKMQEYLLKQQFKDFSVSASEGLHKWSLPSSWSQVALIMRTQPGLDTLSFDDLYNNLRVFERNVKGTTASSSSNTQNVAFVYADNTSSTNDVSTAYSVSSPSLSKSQKEGSSSYTDEVIQSFFTNQSSAPQLDYDDLGQINDDDIEEVDLKWQVAMISMIIKKFHNRTGRKLAKENQGSRRRDGRYNANKARDNGRRPAYQDDSKALVTMDGEDIDWSGHIKEDTQNYAMMAYSSSNLGFDNEVQSCSKTCAKSYVRLKKLYDEQRDKLGDASVEITAYTLALKDLDDKTDVLAYHKKLLAAAVKEKEDLKTKFENWQNYSKNLSRLLNTQMSANDKFGLGYGDYRYGSILSYENEVLQSVFMNKECDLENTPVNDRYDEGMHAVPLPMTGNYMPSGPDVEINYSKFTYGPKQTSVDDSDAKSSENASNESDSSVETTTSMPSQVENAPKTVCEPKVWIDAPIIEEENVKELGTPIHCPKIEKQDRHSHTKKGLGYAFTRKACFVCGSFSHLIRDCDFHEKRMAKQAALTKSKDKVVIRETKEIQGTKSSTTTMDQSLEKVLKIHQANSSQRWIGHMTWTKAHLVDYQEFKGGSVAFGGSNGRITGKGKIKAGMLDFKDVYYVEELKHYNLFFVSQICDKKNKVLFTDTDCLVLSPDFKLPDENQVLLKIPRQHNMYSFNLKNIAPFEDLACLLAKASIDKSNKWHGRLGHMNFKNLNKLVKGNLVRGYLLKFLKMTTPVLLVTDGFSRFRWVYFLKSKDETTPILKDFIRQAEN
nr:hypothetical protein [Tanacetum cinerariifolium]